MLSSGLSGEGGSSDGLLDGWYRLWCELLVPYGLVPIIDTGIVGIVGGRGSVVGRSSPHRKVGTVWDRKIVPKVTWVKQGCGCCSGFPGISKTVAGDIPGRDRPAAVVQLESDLVLGKVVL